MTPGPSNTFNPFANAGATAKSGIGSSVSGAIRSAAKATGADFNYLYKVAVRESSLDPNAKAKTSSATGLFQFIEQTWLGAVKNYGEAHGLGEAANAIKAKPGGGFTVVPANARQSILDLRLDPQKSAALAGEMAQENKRYLENRLGRPVNGAELYAAHFLGPAGAAKLLSASPQEQAASIVPSAAKANRSVFYDGVSGKTVHDVLSSFEKTIGDTAAVIKNGEKTDRVKNNIVNPAPNGEGNVWTAINGALIGAQRAQSVPAGTVGAPFRKHASTTLGADYSNTITSLSTNNNTAVKQSNDERIAKSEALKDLDVLLQRYSGVTDFSPVAAMVLQWFDPSGMRSGR